MRVHGVGLGLIGAERASDRSTAVWTTSLPSPLDAAATCVAAKVGVRIRQSQLSNEWGRVGPSGTEWDRAGRRGAEWNCVAPSGAERSRKEPEKARKEPENAKWNPASGTQQRPPGNTRCKMNSSVAVEDVVLNE